MSKKNAELKLAFAPSRALCPSDVAMACSKDASYKPFSQKKINLNSAISGLENYFRKYCREIARSNDKNLSHANERSVRGAKN